MSDSFVIGVVEAGTMLDDESKEMDLDAAVKLLEDLKSNAEEEGLQVFDVVVVAVPEGRGRGSMHNIAGILRQDIGKPRAE